MKLYLVKLPIHFANSNELFTIGKSYLGNLCPTLYDPKTLQPVPPSYIVRCDDGNLRKVDAVYFITLEEWRQRQLNKII